MAQASSVQREPSMEEILASIRRIIEDNDPGVAATQRQEVAKSSPQAELSEVEDKDAAREIEAFRNSIEQDAPASQPHPVQPSQPKTMTDLQASLQPSAEKGEVVRMPVAAASSAMAEDPQPAFAAEPHPAPEAEASAGTPQTDNSASSIRPADTNRRSWPAEDVQTLRQHSAEAGASEGAVAAPSIISEKAGRQVAAAFEELSEAFAASRRRSFDEMAEEMLRPLLREWMDNNLPVLVERLVREEIERVARGVER